MKLLNKSMLLAFVLLTAASAFAQDDTSRFESSEEEAAEQESASEEKSGAADEGDMSDKGESDDEDDEYSRWP